MSCNGGYLHHVKTFLKELRCRGHRELIHELCHPDWVGQLAIEKPDEFRTKYYEYVKELGELSRD